MARIIAPGLRALLDRLIDYAGMFAPASLSRHAAIANYKSYQSGEHAWMLRWLVIGAAELPHVPRELDGSLAVLSDADEPRAAVIETKRIPRLPPAGPASRTDLTPSPPSPPLYLPRPARHPERSEGSRQRAEEILRFAQNDKGDGGDTEGGKGVGGKGRPVYCEVPLRDLDEVQRAGCFAKVRTGGVKPESIPAVEDVAAFIVACAERRLPFKATAGLHHPIRALHALTYDSDAPRAIMHGFVNVFLAAAFAWHGERKIEPILAETDANAFHFDERARWRDKSLDANQIREARQQFAHSAGSCSFDEPVHDLKALGLL